VKKKSPPYAIIGAVVFGILCIFLFFKWQQSQQQTLADALAKQKADLQAQIDAANAKQAPVVQETTNTRNVYYATQPIEAGVKVSPAFFEKKPTPVDILPDAYSDQNDIVGFYATRKIEKGDPLTPRNVGKNLSHMSLRVSPGMRAISLPVFNAEDNSTGGFVVDGDKVDLFYSPTDNGVKLGTHLLMQNISVLYVPGPPNKSDKTDGVNPVPTPGLPIAITFEVTPEQAQALIYFSSGRGIINMVLKAQKDPAEIKLKPFEGGDYMDNLAKVQKMTDRSLLRVQELQKEIEDQEKKQASQGNTNETTPPPPTP
jgi:Flp pilus assembly protein CpaB